MLPRTVLALALLAACTAARHTVIGVLTKPQDELNVSKGQYVEADIVRLLEANNVRVVPLAYDLSVSELHKQLSYLNGVLWTGGDETLGKGYTYYDTQRRIWLYALAHDLPLFGVCMGFESIFMQIVDATYYTDVLDVGYDSIKLALPLEFASAAWNSKTFKGTPTELRYAMAHENITYNWHEYGVTPSRWLATPKLHDFLIVTSTNKDRNGKPFISSVEAREYPIFAVQFHPEAGWWWDTDNVAHSEDATWASNWVLRPFLKAARQNTHKFPTHEDEVAALIGHTAPEFDETDDGYEIWYWPATSA